MIDRKYGRVTLENKPHLAASLEPCLVLRAQDIHAEAAIRFYASLVAAGGNSALALFAMQSAGEFSEYRGLKKRPD